MTIKFPGPTAFETTTTTTTQTRKVFFRGRCYACKILTLRRVVVVALSFDEEIMTLLLQGSISPSCLPTAFTRADPKSAKKDSQFKQLSALLGSAHVKAGHQHVDEIDP